MTANAISASIRFRRLAHLALAASALGLLWAGPASAYIADSFLRIPDAKGHYKGTDHLGWVHAESDAWSTSAAGMGIAFGFGSTNGGPNAPRPGTAGQLYLMLSKTNPDAALLMERCKKKTMMPELTFSDPWGRAAPPGAPAYLDYKLKNAQIVDCPVVAGAVAQAFVLSFQDIDWLNYAPPQMGAAAGRPGRRGPAAAGGAGGAAGAGGQARGTDQAVGQGQAAAVGVGAARGGDPADIAAMVPIEPIAPGNGRKVKDYLVTWLGVATDSTPEQCPVLNAKPGDADFFRYRTPAEIAAIKAKYGEKGLTAGGETERRGPDNLNVVTLPGIVPDPGFHEPLSNVAEGLNLDGDNGAGKPPKGIRKHKNYTSPDGRSGIDNQLYTVLGCIPGYRGKAGYRMQTDNARRADGNIVTIIEVSGITDEMNSPDVTVSLIHAVDKPIKDNAGKIFIANYTFRPTEDPRFAAYNMRVKGRIVNGVVETDVLPKYSINSGQGPVYDLFQARLRIEPQPDGNVKAILGGYLDWRYYDTLMSSGYSEGLFGFQQPSVYYAFRRNADGLYNAATGEYDGISAAYELDGVPAFMTPMPKPANATTAAAK